MVIKVTDNLEIKAYYAGHVLGAAMFHVRAGHQSVVYTVRRTNDSTMELQTLFASKAQIMSKSPLIYVHFCWSQRSLRFSTVYYIVICILSNASSISTLSKLSLLL
jgi:hypothetical protein